MTNVDDTYGYFNIHWNKLDPGTLIGNCGAATNNNQYKDMMRNYTYYYIYGLGIKFVPRIYG